MKRENRYLFPYSSPSQWFYTCPFSKDRLLQSFRSSARTNRYSNSEQEGNVKLNGIMNIIKTPILAFIMILYLGVVAYAENWELVGAPGSEFQELINTFNKYLTEGAKKDVLEAFSKTSYKVYVDTGSIKDVGDKRKDANLKVVLDKEQDLEGTDKKFKYDISLMTFDCAQDVMWFKNGSVYDKEGELVRDSQTVYVPIDLKKIPPDSLEKELMKFICNYK